MIMEVATDPLAFESWVQVCALLILVVGGLGWRYMSVINSNAKATSEVVTKIDKSLSTNNSGSHVKDSLDRLEATNAEIIANQTVITHNQAEIIKAQDEHVVWAEAFDAEQKKMHKALEESIDCHDEKLATMWKLVAPE